MDVVAITAIVFGSLFAIAFMAAAYTMYKDEKFIENAMEVAGRRSSMLYMNGKRVMSKMSLPVMMQQKGNRREYDLPSYYFDE